MQATFALTSSLDSLVRREYTCWIHIGFWWPNVFRPIPQTPSPKFMKPWQSSTSLGEKLNLGEFLSRAILSTIVSSVRIPWCNMIPSSVWIQSWNKLWWLVGSLEFYTSTWLKQFRHGSSDKRVDSHQSYPPIWDLALPQIAASYSFERKKQQASTFINFAFSGLATFLLLRPTGTFIGLSLDAMILPMSYVTISGSFPRKHRLLKFESATSCPSPYLSFSGDSTMRLLIHGGRIEMSTPNDI